MSLLALECAKENETHLIHVIVESLSISLSKKCRAVRLLKNVTCGVVVLLTWMSFYIASRYNVSGILLLFHL